MVVASNSPRPHPAGATRLAVALGLLCALAGCARGGRNTPVEETLSPPPPATKDASTPVPDPAPVDASIPLPMSGDAGHDGGEPGPAPEPAGCVPGERSCADSGSLALCLPEPSTPGVGTLEAQLCPEGAPDCVQGECLDSCDTVDALRCAGQAQAARQRCDGEGWVEAQTCVGGLCDNMDASCAVPVGECAGRSPGESYCNGATLQICDPDLVRVQTQTCESSAHCLTGDAPRCAACIPGQWRCEERTLWGCDEAALDWTQSQQCETAELCNAVVGDCSTATCNPGQYRCEGDALEVCNVGQDGWDLQQTCEAGRCDALGGQCDLCNAGVSVCNGMARSQVCSADGQELSDTECTGGTPRCTGAGVCVGCVENGDCAEGSASLCDPGSLACVQCLGLSDCPAQTCQVTSCDGGSCRYAPALTGEICAGGLCDGSGSCVECLDINQCSSPECYLPTCNGGSCGTTPTDPGASCSGGRCDGSGNCVACLGSQDCEAAECYLPTCESNTCGSTPADPGSACSGGQCDGSGNCVQCLEASECSAPECYLPACVGGSCGSTPADPGSACSGGQCDGSGNCVECLEASECNASECYLPTCEGGSCGSTPADPGSACSGGLCDGSGNCVECLDTSSCSASECYLPTCEGGSCGSTPAAPGDVCGGGQCDGSGQCLACVDPSVCPAAECEVATCEANTCGTSSADAGTPCSGGQCDGTGSCIECTDASACSAAECYVATCEANTCGSVEADAATRCAGDTGTCDGAGVCVSDCAASETSCDQVCVDTRSNMGNCGACGHACPGGNNIACSGSLCIYDCGSNCDAYVDGSDCSAARYQGRDYLFCDVGSSSERKTWTEARNWCRNRGMDLAIVDSLEEDDWIDGQIDDQTWIGANDRSSEGQWRWVQPGTSDNGTLLSDLYNGGWNSGEPNNASSSCGFLSTCYEHCAELNEVGWNDADCDDDHDRWVCESY